MLPVDKYSPTHKNGKIFNKYSEIENHTPIYLFENSKLYNLMFTARALITNCPQVPNMDKQWNFPLFKIVQRYYKNKLNKNV